jgi:hypothetical protein
MSGKDTPPSNDRSLEQFFKMLPTGLNTPEHRALILHLMGTFAVSGTAAFDATQAKAAKIMAEENRPLNPVEVIPPEFGIETMQRFWSGLTPAEITHRATLLRSLIDHPIGLDVMELIMIELHNRFSTAHKSRTITLERQVFKKFLTELLRGEDERVRVAWSHIRNNPSNPD